MLVASADSSETKYCATDVQLKAKVYWSWQFKKKINAITMWKFLNFPSGMKTKSKH